MRLTRKAVLAGVASLAVAGAAWAAEKPAKPQVQVMEVALPDGGVARISYSGDVAPQVGVSRMDKDAIPAAFDPAPFAAMDRIMAEMDARAVQMMGRMREMQVRMAADRSRYPVLLANGKCLATGEDEDGMHWAQGADPFPKPS